MQIAQTNIALYRQLMAAGWGDADLRRLAAAYAVAMRLFGNQFRSNGKPFICHAVGTASILAAHRADPDVVLAGLLHAAYTHGEFAAVDTLPWARRQRALRRAVGPEVEALVAGYAKLRETAFAAAAPRLVLMRLANEIEDHLDGAPGFSRKAGLAAGDATVTALIARAEQLGHRALGDQLGQVIADQPAVPAALRRSGRGSFTPGRPAQQLKRLLHRLGNVFLRVPA